MKLAAYLSLHNCTYSDFALLTGATIFAVGKWARHERLPRPDAMRKIAEVTAGAVTANDFNDVEVAVEAPRPVETGPPAVVA
jgi:hypothetical protein